MDIIRKQLTAVTAFSYALIPAISCALALNIGIIHFDIITQSNLMLLLPLLVFVFTAIVIIAINFRYFNQFLLPVNQFLKTDTKYNHQGNNVVESVHLHLNSFSVQYWSRSLPFILLLPLAYQAARGDQLSYVVSWQTLELTLLILLTTLIVALPGYLLSLTVIGQISEHIGLKYVQISLRAKMMLVGSYLPLIVSVIFIAYFVWVVEAISADILIIWLIIAASIFVSSLIVIDSLKSSLTPIHRIFNDNNPLNASDVTSVFGHSQLASQLLPRSNDEIGLLMQNLTQLFNRLDQQDNYFKAIFNHAAEAIIVVNDIGQIVLFNPAAEKLFNYQAIDFVQNDLADVLPSFITADGKPVVNDDKVESEAIRLDGSKVAISVSISELRINSRTCYAYLAQDISKRRATEALLQSAEDRYRTLVETAHDLVWSMNTNGVWTYLNNAGTRIYGYQLKEMIGHNFTEFQADVSHSQDKRALKRLLLGDELVHYETILKHKDGTQRHISFNAKPVYNERDTIISITGTARDITDQKAYENELTYQSQHDSLTGLLNRRYFHQELTRVIARVARSGMECALLYIDLDQFKYINDTLGHAAGDNLLIECTNLLQKHTRDGDMLARFGGDEFTILLYNIAPSKAQNVAENLRELFDKYRFYQKGKAYNVTCSIGLSIIDNNISSPDEALSRADLACNIAKAQGRNCVHTSNKRDEEKMGMSEDMGWAARVRDAYENDKFALMYQPIFSISDKKVVDYEVLLRIPLSDGGMILPGGFIPAAERFGLIHQVDRWTVRKAIMTLSEINNAGHYAKFAINLSGRAFDDQELLPLIANLLRETDLDPQLLTFEITETEAIENLASATKFICKLKDLGCKFALDDFGSGFSSFNYLKNLPVDILKIDGSFVQALHNTHVDQAMVQSMNQIAHALGKKTIAEFVENNDTLNLLESYGVDFAQGHYLGRPQLDILSDITQRKATIKTASNHSNLLR